MLKVALQLLSSLRLTVVLLALGIVLVFFGTLGQVSDGLYLAQDRYFRSWFTYWNPVGKEWLRIPLAGGYLLGTLLVLNLCVAHFVRFKLSWKKSGIFLTHLGIIALLLGQLATDMFSVESQMSFREGESRNYTEDFHKNELVFTRDVPGTDREQVVAIPESRLLQGDIQTDPLPFRVVIRDYYENADVQRWAPRIHTNRQPSSTQGMGVGLLLDPLPPTREMDKRNLPATVLELKDLETGDSLGTWLTSALLRPDQIEVGEDVWRVELRPTRYYYPFQITLLKTTHDKYLGTEIPRHFQSRVRIENDETGENREVEIYMNHPLRYAGLTFFQYQMGEDQSQAVWRGTSSLQVVKNPSWLTPYVACILVGLGLTVQFSIHLGGFLKSRFKPGGGASGNSSNRNHRQSTVQPPKKRRDELGEKAGTAAGDHGAKTPVQTGRGQPVESSKP
jgi:hypothetical protein